MSTLSFATEEIAKNDLKFQDLIKNKNLIVQWTVGNDGPNFFFKIENGNFRCIKNQIHPNPDIKISINNLMSAIKVLDGNLENIKREVETRNMTITGSDSNIEKFYSILGQIQKYMGDLRD